MSRIGSRISMRGKRPERLLCLCLLPITETGGFLRTRPHIKPVISAPGIAKTAFFVQTLTTHAPSLAGRRSGLDNVENGYYAATQSFRGHGSSSDGRVFRIQGDLGVVPADHRADAPARDLYREPPRRRGDHEAQAAGAAQHRHRSQ